MHYGKNKFEHKTYLIFRSKLIILRFAVGSIDFDL